MYLGEEHTLLLNCFFYSPARVTDSWDVSCVGWELNSGHMKKQSVFSNAKPSLQPPWPKIIKLPEANWEGNLSDIVKGTNVSRISKCV